MKLSFSVHDQEQIKVYADRIEPEIAQFFSDEFNLKFQENILLIGYPQFMRKYNVINSFLYHRNIQLHASEEFHELINVSPKYKSACDAVAVSENQILETLISHGFKRSPTENQLKNLTKLCSLKACASFSVPGAGKTTEALAFHAFHKRNISSKLLVISPINAFTSWDDEYAECYEVEETFTRLRGSTDQIKSMLADDDQFNIINYDALRSNEKFNLIKDLILHNPDITVILDESHKSKGESISQILGQLSPYIPFKLILTGTPMPQAPSDLRAQFGFLYPHEFIQLDNELLQKFEPLYVRTTKGNLGLMPPKYTFHKVSPRPTFEYFYNEYIEKPLSNGTELEEIFAIRSFKKAVLKLLKLLSNPVSCIDDIIRIDPSLLTKIMDEGNGAKIDAVIDRTNQLINSGEKVIIWSSFIINVESLASQFTDKAVFIHGGVKSGSGEDEELGALDTRESKIKRFKEDPGCMVLIANPAAAAESISLHKHCNYALYLDRTYNAGQFLQSQDRIHRYIRKELEVQKYIEIFSLDIPNCVDEKVHKALNRKIDNMACFLSDPSLMSLQGFDFDLDSAQNEALVDSVDIDEFYSR